MRLYLRLLISLCAAVSVLPLEAATADEWHRAEGGDGLEYRWTMGFWQTCHIEFRDAALKGTSRNTEFSGEIDYDRTTLNGVERNALQPFRMMIFDAGAAAGPDVGCETIHEIRIHELKRSSPPLGP